MIFPISVLLSLVLPATPAAGGVGGENPCSGSSGSCSDPTSPRAARALRPAAPGAGSKHAVSPDVPRHWFSSPQSLALAAGTGSGSSCAAFRVRAVDDAYTAASGNWASTSRPVHPSGGVHTRWKRDKARKKVTVVRPVRSDLISRARAGDRDAFRELTEPHRRELHVHCYRMLGSFQDAEDVLQDTLLAAWQGLGGFEGRASIRTWLYRIATNRCLNARRSASRRPAMEWNIPEVAPPEPTRLGEVVWLEPFPDALLEGAIDVPLGPQARSEQ